MESILSQAVLDVKLVPPELADCFEPAECGECYVCRMVEIFREVRRVLRRDGVLFVVIGDSSARAAKKGQRRPGDCGKQDYIYNHGGGKASAGMDLASVGLKPKDTIGIPWMLAFALRADGWHLRSPIIWAKPNPMPESVTDRPTKSYEHVFLLSKSERYFYDADAVRESAGVYAGAAGTFKRENSKRAVAIPGQTHGTHRPGRRNTEQTGSRNLRDVWTIPTEPYPGAHFATFPRALVRPMVKAGCPEKTCATCGAPWKRMVEKSRTFESGSGRSGSPPVGKHGRDLQGGGETLDIRRGPVVHVRTLGFTPTCSCPAADPVPSILLDPFVGSGTTCIVAWELGRRSIGFEASAAYSALARNRVRDATVGPLFAEEG